MNSKWKKSGSTHKIKVRKGNDNFMPWVLSKFFHRPSKNLITILFCKTKLLWQVHVDTCSWSIRGNHQPKWPPKPDKLNAFGPQKAPFYLASGFNVLYWTKSSNWDLVFLPIGLSIGALNGMFVIALDILEHQAPGIKYDVKVWHWSKGIFL